MDRAEQVGNRRWQGPLGVGLALALSWPLGAVAQTSANADAPKSGEVDRSKLTDAERARRDADRVFNFIKFHAVRPAAPAPAPAAAARPAPRPAVPASPAPAVAGAAAAPAAAPAAPAAAATPAPAAAATAGATPVAAPAPASTVAAPVASAAPEVSNAAAQPGNASPAAASAPGFDPRTLPPASPPPAVTSEPAPAAEPEPEEVDLKLVKYVAPELDARAMAAVTTPTATVRVRFTVMPNGTVGSVTALPSTNRISAAANRALGAVATRAVAQWRFEPVKEAREVEVNVDFRLD